MTNVPVNLIRDIHTTSFNLIEFLYHDGVFYCVSAFYEKKSLSNGA